MVGQAPHIGFELAHVGGAVAVAQDQQVDLLRRRAVDADRDRPGRRRGLHPQHVLGLGVDLDAPHRAENWLRSSRLSMRTLTGLPKSGKRTDSWKPR
jgi:hypothetical protein